MKKKHWMTALMLVASTAGADDALTLKLDFKDSHFYPDRLEAPAGKPIRLEINNATPNSVEFESTDLRKEELVLPDTQSVVEIRPLRPGQYRFFDDLNKGSSMGVLIVK